eukprot:TRINITY_DN5295_c0_g1_i1.p1 TRINITY_DN5295_c0_g1~~TRINITY_DN5295_c0_g1_i1.p1  ORF type:complete len:493 (+),score=87.48 TRINITY_DN5295_c0_g1_i1:22-1500(+)
MEGFTTKEVSVHNKPHDNWIIVNGNVYDVTKWTNNSNVPAHPGGKKVLINVAGTDATAQFAQYHNNQVLETVGSSMLIGRVEDQKKDTKKGDKFGSDIPFAEPAWYRGLQSPHYNDTHRKFRAKIREHVEKDLIPFVSDWEEAGDYPRELHQKAYASGVYGAIWPVEYGGTPPPGFDIFHELILFDELMRCACGGILAALGSINIALPPILAVGSEEMKQRYARDAITGKIILALAITEPGVGSDVARIETIAKKENGKYIVNGQKKFITSGMKADYFTTAVRTSDKGISLLLIDAKSPGITRRRLKTQGWWPSNTAHIVFENVEVPESQLIGVENAGFLAIMLNFNHERFMLIVKSCRASRICIEEAIKYARIRKTFGKRLIDHQVIRHKIGEMVGRVELLQSRVEDMAYQLKVNANPQLIAAQAALLKVQSTKTMELCAREASQILGGASFIRGGHGEKVERIYRDVRVNAIGGGSEEIMFDLAMKQSRL